MNKEQPTGTEKTQNGTAKKNVCLRRRCRRRPRCSLAWTTTMAMATIFRHCIYLFYRLWLRFAVRNIIDGNVFYAEYKTQIIIIIKSRTRDTHMRQPHGSVYNSHFFSFHRSVVDARPLVMHWIRMRRMYLPFASALLPSLSLSPPSHAGRRRWRRLHQKDTRTSHTNGSRQRFLRFNFIYFLVEGMKGTKSTQKSNEME